MGYVETVSFLVRLLKNKRYWDPKKEGEEWIPADDIRADAVNNFQTTDNCFSVYKIDEADDSLIDRILIAIAATKDNADKIDYAVIDDELFNSLNIEFEKIDGMTPDNDINSMHLDVIKVSGGLLVSMTKEVMLKVETKRMSIKSVKKKIIEYLGKGYLDKNKMRKKLVDSLEDT